MPIKREPGNIFPIAHCNHSKPSTDLSRLSSIPYCINCTDVATGAVGTFAFDESLFMSGLGHFAISPIFEFVGDFYDWCKSEGFVYFDTKQNFVMLREFPV